MTIATFRFKFQGEIIESDVVEATAKEWACDYRSDDPAWSVLQKDDRVMANRLVFPPGMTIRQSRSGAFKL
jgi:hypothetical protein